MGTQLRRLPTSIGLAALGAGAAGAALAPPYPPPGAGHAGSAMLPDTKTRALPEAERWQLLPSSNPSGERRETRRQPAVEATMDERELREWIGQVQDRHAEPPPVHADDGRPGAHRSDGGPDAGLVGGWGRDRPGPDPAGLHADPAGRRGPAPAALVAGPDAPEPPLRHRHQGPGRLAALLRAAGGLRPRRKPRPGPGRGGPQPPERRRREGRPLRHVEAQARGPLARRPALHG